MKLYNVIPFIIWISDIVSISLQARWNWETGTEGTFFQFLYISIKALQLYLERNSNLNTLIEMTKAAFLTKAQSLVLFSFVRIVFILTIDPP